LDPLIRAKLQDELLELQARVKKTILFVSHDLDEALKLGDRISILREGRIIQTGTAEDIVLAPADAYVSEFVQHMNPLTVLTGSMIMRRRADLHSDGENLWLDAAGRYRLRLAVGGEALALQLDGVAHSLRIIESEADLQAAPGMAVVPADLSLRSIVRLHQTSGHPVLVAHAGRIVGVCGEADIILALAGAGRAAIAPSNRSDAEIPVLT
jgi:glycine betaine/proline transport system ATP-binding protein